MGRLQAQACQSSHVMCFTLTYRKEYRDYRNRAHRDHITKFRTAFKDWIGGAYRKAGRAVPRVKTMAVPEYGQGLNERDRHCHWHVIAFIEGGVPFSAMAQLDPSVSCAAGADFPSAQAGIHQSKVKRSDLRRVLDDKNILFFPDENSRKWRQTFKVWRYGTVNFDIMGNGFRPFSGAVVAYLLKYVTKDQTYIRLPNSCGDKAILASHKLHGYEQRAMDVNTFAVQGFFDINYRTKRHADEARRRGGVQLDQKPYANQRIPLSGPVGVAALRAYRIGFRRKEKERIRVLQSRGRTFTVQDVRSRLSIDRMGLAQRRWAYSVRKHRHTGPLVTHCVQVGAAYRDLAAGLKALWHDLERQAREIEAEQIAAVKRAAVWSDWLSDF